MPFRFLSRIFQKDTTILFGIRLKNDTTYHFPKFLLLKMKFMVSGSNVTSPKFLIQYNNEYLQITRSASNPYQQLHHIRSHTDRNIVIILFVMSPTFLFLLTHAIACFIFYGLVCTSRKHCHAYHNNFHRLTLFPFRSLNPFVRPYFDQHPPQVC